MLFDKVIFGPIKSRRLGNSLGVNLLPENGKICNFDCIYCECGFNFKDTSTRMPSREYVKEQLEYRLTEFADKGEPIDTITFAGNGEPTIHPDFPTIIDDVMALRDRLAPNAKISVLSNATQVIKPEVFEALKKIDNNILKIDSAIEDTLNIINQPIGRYSLDSIVEKLKKFEGGNLTVQTLFFSGKYEGNTIDNTSDQEVEAWLKVIEEIRPKSVMLYTLDRPTPAKNLEKASVERLRQIAQMVEDLGITTQING
ncbi:MAG: radical SAM protein [Bacteroidales bacterium]|nr:MAG: radical SAM protein [Bacteroidales bacterium]